MKNTGNTPIQQHKLRYVFVGIILGWLLLLTSQAQEASVDSYFKVNREEAQWIDEAQILLSQQQPESAESLLTTKTTVTSSLSLWQCLAKIQWDLGHTEQAEASLLHILKKVPQHRQSLQQLAQLYQHLQRHQDAVLYWIKLVQLFPEAQYYAALGQAYAESEQFLNSETAFRRAHLLAPNNQASFWGLLRALSEQHRYMECVAMCRSELKQQTNNPTLWKTLVQALRALNQNEEALVELELARLYCPSADFDSQALDFYLESGLLPQARALFEKLKSQLTLRSALLWGHQFLIHHDLVQTNFCLDFCAESLTQIKTENADQQSSTNSGKSSTSSYQYTRYQFQYLVLRARATEAKGSISAAIEQYKIALEHQPLDPFLLIHLSQLLLDEDASSAEALLLRAVQIDSIASQAWLYLGDIYAKAKKWDSALTSIRKSLQLHPSEATQRYYDSVLKFSREDGFGARSK
jgi:tetratricopeptide (TPR) repeat protein